MVETEEGYSWEKGWHGQGPDDRKWQVRLRGQHLAGREERRHRGPEVGACLECLRNRTKTRVTRAW